MKPENLASAETAFIERAAQYLERPSFLISLASAIGRPIEKMTEKLPERVKGLINGATHQALMKATGVAVRTISPKLPNPDFSDIERQALDVIKHHGTAAAVTGGVSGFFGGWTIGIELPLSTTIMIRSIAEIAGVFGEDLGDVTTKMECLTVFAFGGRSRSDDAAESSYFVTRAGLSKILTDASKILGKQAAAEGAKALGFKTAPIVRELLSRIAQRFELVVSEKFLAQAVPIVGAIGGASINTLFANHFARTAVYHFGLRHLERKYGADAVRTVYMFAKDKIGTLP